MSYLRSVQPLIADTLADLPSAAIVAAHSGLGDAIIFVEEDGSVRRWEAISQSWTRRGGPVVGTAAALNTPIPMSSLSAPLKAQSDAITSTGYATAAQGTKADSALQNASVFATTAQGAKADSALQNAAAFASASQGGKADSALQLVPAATVNSAGLIPATDYAQLQFIINLTQYWRRAVVVKHGVSIGTANADSLILTSADVPTKYLITRVSIFNASSAISTATAGLYTGAAGVGAIVGPAMIVAANANVVFDFSGLALTARTNIPLYFHITVPKAATTVSLLVEFLNLA